MQERFLDNPHIYIGLPGQQSPKREGRERIKRRKFELAEPFSDTTASYVSSVIRSMMGIKNFSIDGGSVEITYDLLEATAEQIESQLESIGAHLGHNWGQQLRLGFVHCLEETELDSLEAPTSTHHQNH